MKANTLTHTKRFLFTLIFFTICFQEIVFAQTEIELEKLIREATINIYENPELVIKIGDSIYEIAKEDRTKIKALNLISDAYSSTRNYQKSLEFFLKANQLSKNVDDQLLQIRIATKIAILYQQLKIYDKTIHFLDDAEKLITKYPNQDSVVSFLSNNYIVRGLIYKEKLNCEIANGFFDKGISYLNEINTELSRANLSITYYNKGNCYIMLGNNLKAKESFKSALKNAQSVNAHSLQAFALKGLAEVYTKEGFNHEAINILEEALSLSKNVGDLILYKTIYDGLRKNYLSIDNLEKYREYNTYYLNTIFSIKHSERGSVSNSLDESEREKKLELEHLKTKYNILIFSLIVFCFFIVLIFILNELRINKSIKKIQAKIKKLQ